MMKIFSFVFPALLIVLKAPATSARCKLEGECTPCSCDEPCKDVGLACSDDHQVALQALGIDKVLANCGTNLRRGSGVCFNEDWLDQYKKTAETTGNITTFTDKAAPAPVTPSPTPSPTKPPTPSPTKAPTYSPDTVLYGSGIKIKSPWRNDDSSWLTGGRNSKNEDVHTRNPTTNYESTTPTVPETYEWLLYSTFTLPGQVDPKVGECIRFGDKIMLKMSVYGLWLNGGRSGGNYEVKTRDPEKNSYEANIVKGGSYSFAIRSDVGNGKLDLNLNQDPQKGQCVTTNDKVFLQVQNTPNRWLNGGRDGGNGNVYTRDRTNSYEKTIAVGHYQWQFKTFAKPSSFTSEPASGTSGYVSRCVYARGPSWFEYKAVDFDPMSGVRVVIKNQHKNIVKDMTYTDSTRLLTSSVYNYQMRRYDLSSFTDLLRYTHGAYNLTCSFSLVVDIL